jgi:hypothetical protein
MFLLWEFNNKSSTKDMLYLSKEITVVRSSRALVRSERTVRDEVALQGILIGK